jgi:hypothetical protein
MDTLGSKNGLAAVVLAAAVLLSACGYRPVSDSPAGVAPNLQVVAITNDTYKPGLQAVVSAAILRHLRLEVQRTAAEGRPPDFILSGSVTGYENDAIAYTREDIGQRFRVRVSMLAILTPRGGGAARLRETIVGQAFYTTGADVVGTRAAENEAAFRAAQDLARRLMARIVEVLCGKSPGRRHAIGRACGTRALGSGRSGEGVQPPHQAGLVPGGGVLMHDAFAGRAVDDRQGSDQCVFRGFGLAGGNRRPGVLEAGP